MNNTPLPAMNNYGNIKLSKYLVNMIPKFFALKIPLKITKNTSESSSNTLISIPGEQYAS
jgi:hypothetical protein